MYRDLAEAVENFKDKGYCNLYEDQNFRKLAGSEKMPDYINKMKIKEVYHFDEGTDPGDESTLYLLQQPDQTNCYMVLSYGMYKDPEKANLVDALKKLEGKHS